MLPLEKEKLDNLVEDHILKTWMLEELNEDGTIGWTLRGRNSERITLTFPCGKTLILSTYCTGCLENTGFSIE